MGADIIKADPCTNLEAYLRVIEVAGDIPVLVRGGGKTTDEEIIKRTAMLMQQGASGIIYGRNIIRRKHPAHITRLLMDIVHGAATLEDTLAKIK